MGGAKQIVHGTKFLPHPEFIKKHFAPILLGEIIPAWSGSQSRSQRVPKYGLDPYNFIICREKLINREG